MLATQTLANLHRKPNDMSRRSYSILRQMLPIVVVTLAIVGRATLVPAAETKTDFSRQVLPILSNKCFTCHGPDAEDDQLRLDDFETASEDRGGYRAIDPDRPDDSELLARIHSTDDPMPPADAEKQLTPEERKILSDWVSGGGRYARHWAFVPPQKPTQIDNRQAIDHFISNKLQSHGLTFAPPADRATLARRASLTLTGLPPEPQQLVEFLADTKRDAYVRYVDQLLNSPRFGEHQARYWLDAVRYGDTHGLHLDNRRGIYPYRDWVARAFNENLPLDEFIRWQIAGDLLDNPSLDQQIATGFIRLNPTTGEGGAIPAEFQAKNNFDRVETIGTVFLGMSLTCARCHTHKYDPTPQVEYYRLMAFFNSTAEPAMDSNAYTFGPTVQVPADEPAWKQWRDLQATRKRLLLEFEQDLSNLSEDLQQRWHNGTKVEQLAMLADSAGPFQDHDQHQSARQLAESIKSAEEAFTGCIVAQDLPELRATRVLRRGEYDQPIGDALEPGVLSAMGQLPLDAPKNRLGLAEWLTSPDHPLVARVLVNRLWQRIFGEALVRTPEDFGLQGEQPTHPQLLDWLAGELQESDWNLKHLLKLMVTSRTFRQNSAWRDDVDDPQNRMWARGPRYRLDAEVLRDLGLWASGLLDPKIGGEGVKPYQPAGLWAALAHPASNTKEYVRDNGAPLYRRSLYVYWKRTSPHPMMILFDAPDREASCVRRSRTNTSLQSLGLFNETQRIEMGRQMAARLLRAQSNDDQRLEKLFQLLASRSPTTQEANTCMQLLQSLHQRYEDAPDDARQLLAHGDAPHDDTLPVSQHAAWTQLCVTVLASDLAMILY